MEWSASRSATNSHAGAVGKFHGCRQVIISFQIVITKGCVAARPRHSTWLAQLPSSGNIIRIGALLNKGPDQREIAPFKLSSPQQFAPVIVAMRASQSAGNCVKDLKTDEFPSFKLLSFADQKMQHPFAVRYPDSRIVRSIGASFEGERS